MINNWSRGTVVNTGATVKPDPAYAPGTLIGKNKPIVWSVFARALSRLDRGLFSLIIVCPKKKNAHEGVDFKSYNSNNTDPSHATRAGTARPSHKGGPWSAPDWRTRTCSHARWAEWC